MSLPTRKLVDLCVGLGSVPVALFTNAATAVLQKLAECNSIQEACAQANLPGGVAIPVACVLGALGLTSAAIALRGKQDAAKVAEEFAAMAKDVKAIDQAVRTLAAVLEPVGDPTKRLGAAELEQLGEALAMRDATKVTDGTAQRMMLVLESAGLAKADVLNEMAGYTKETWLTTLHDAEEQEAAERWLREADERIRGVLEGIARDAKIAAEEATAAKMLLAGETDEAVEAVVGPGRLAGAYANRALVQRAQGDLAGARLSMERAIAIDLKHLAPDHLHFATRYSNLAVLQRQQGDLPAAQDSMERAIAIKLKHSGPDHRTSAFNYSILAQIQEARGDLPGAQGSMERAIAIKSKHLAPVHPSLAHSWSALATIQLGRRDLAGARASMENAIAIECQYLGADDPSLANRWTNLATIQKDQGDLSAARASLEKAIAIDSKHRAPDHPFLAFNYFNLAMIQKDQGDLHGARESIERAIAIQSSRQAPDQPSIANWYANLAMIQRCQGDEYRYSGEADKALEEFAAARASMHRVIETEQKHFGPDHPGLAQRYDDLAQIQWRERDIPGAQASLEQAIALARRQLPEDDLSFADWYQGLAHVLGSQEHYSQKRYEGAKVLLERSIAITQKHLGPVHPRLAVTYAHLAWVQRILGEFENAKASTEREIAIRERAAAPDLPNIAESCRSMQEILYAIGDYEGAMPYMRRAIAIRERLLEKDDPELAADFGLLGRLELRAEYGDRGHANLRRAFAILRDRFADESREMRWIRRLMAAADCPE
jgi:tetratricopeptide (TPR) repeat protein